MRATFYQEQEKYDASIQDLNKAIQLSPKEPLFYLMRGLNYMSQRIVYKRASEDFSKAIELNPNLSKAYLWRGYVFQYQGNCPAADTDFKKACELGWSSACKDKCKRF